MGEAALEVAGLSDSCRHRPRGRHAVPPHDAPSVAENGRYRRGRSRALPRRAPVRSASGGKIGTRSHSTGRACPCGTRCRDRRSRRKTARPGVRPEPLLRASGCISPRRRHRDPTTSRSGGCQAASSEREHVDLHGRHPGLESAGPRACRCRRNRGDRALPRCVATSRRGDVSAVPRRARIPANHAAGVAPDLRQHARREKRRRSPRRSDAPW